MPLSVRDKVIIAYTVVIEYLAKMDRNTNISGNYKNIMFSRLFVMLQSHFFQTMNPKEIQGFIEEADVLKIQMRELVTSAVLEAAKMTQQDTPMPSEDKSITSKLDPNNLIDQIIEFHDEAVRQIAKADAINLITNQSLKIVGIKGRPREEVKKLVIKRLERYGQKKV